MASLNPVRIIDDFLFDRVFQPVANRLFRRVNSAEFLRFLLIGYLVLDLAQFALLFAAGIAKSMDVIITVGLAVVWAAYYSLEGLLRDTIRGGRNPLRITPWFMAARLLSLVAVVGSIGAEWATLTLGLHDKIVPGMMQVADTLLLTSYFYLAGCDEPPPAKIVPAAQPQPI